MESASGMISSASKNTPLRLVADADDGPAKMFGVLDARYASNFIASQIAVQKQLYQKRYNGQNMSKYIDEYFTLFSPLEFIGKTVAIPDLNKVPMLLASIDQDSEMERIAVTLRTTC